MLLQIQRAVDPIPSLCDNGGTNNVNAYTVATLYGIIKDRRSNP